MYQLEISHNAHQQIRKLPAQTRERINNAVARLAVEPRPPGVRKLLAKDGYRIRVGDYRVLYLIDDEVKIVTIYRVMPRENVYRF
ncbi:MAG: type II toxin-antitoxin system RelE/ParE family toxin [Chloroflexota bacterium]|nr:type II toxin-antitoxin system RelE/ParE family toxin [Chloroflexota bacterium]